MSRFYEGRSHLVIGGQVKQLSSNLLSEMANDGTRNALSFILKGAHRWRPDTEDNIRSQKTIRSLMKILEHTTDRVLDFKDALTSGPWSNCVTIPRSGDGRIQVNFRKVLPHVIFCKAWRMPDLQSKDELIPIESCKFSFHANVNRICINPFHYEKIGSPQRPAVVIPDFNEYVPECSQLTFSRQIESHVPHNMTYSENGFTSTGQDSYSNPVSHTPPASIPGSMTPSTQCDISPERDGSTPESLVSYQEPEYWISVAYYELNTRVGEIFKSYIPSIYVDGYTDPRSDRNRFCLGQLSNINRTPSIENTRRRIGRGVHLYLVYGQVYAECLSNSPIFVQSRNLNKHHGFHPSTVCKIKPGCSIKIFDNHEFARHMAESVYYGHEAVYELTKMCIIRMSFVKGWGAEYHRRDATATPCWIEIHMNGPLQWLDRVLVQMGPPTNPISSKS